MDPAKVDGLARVLERAARTRQVIVFTHDDRLPEAIRRLGIDSTMVEVARGEISAVSLREAKTPVERHVEDARVLLRSDDLPEAAVRRVVPGFCRLALFDDVDKGGDVLARLRNEFGPQYADAFQAVQKGAHHGFDGNLQDLVRDSAVLARRLAERA
jgi:hypothetical protein